MDLNETLEDVIATNENLLEDVESITKGSINYDGVVYKLLRLNLATLSRLQRLYEANNQPLKQGQLSVANQVIMDLFRTQIATATKEE